MGQPAGLTRVPTNTWQRRSMDARRGARSTQKNQTNCNLKEKGNNILLTIIRMSNVRVQYQLMGLPE